ncbi:DUF7089 family protein [Haloferacaceae archaeon DSL9]
MFSERSLSPEIAAVRDEYAPDAVTLDVESDFETLPPPAAENLGLVVDELDPTTYPTEWLPESAPTLLRRYAGGEFTIGMPGDGTIVWTTQTRPPTVLAKRRARGTPDDFLAFLLAEAYVQLSLDVPEHFLPFFGARYRDLDAAVGLGAGDVYQIAAALFDGWVGLRTRAEFADWADRHPQLFATWQDAGARLEPRLPNLAGEVARGELRFPEATEYACSAIKHGLELPAPFAALDTQAYREYGAAYAVRWAEKTFEQLRS